MITLTLLAIFAITIIIIALCVGAGLLVVFGDLIVAIIVLRVIFGLVSRRKEEEDLD